MDHPLLNTEAPEFSLLDHEGNEVTLGAVLPKHKLVLVFYPGDETPGCTAQLCAIRDEWADFQAANIMVYGVNPGDAESHTSIAVNAVTNPSIVSMAASKLTGALPAISGASLTNLTAANISAGSLGGSVIASSVAVNSISNAQVAAGAAISASKIVGGTFGSGTDFQIAAGDSLGIGVAPSNTLQVNGPIATKIRSVSANTSLDATDSIVIVDTSGGSRTISLPAMDATTAGRELKIFNVGTNNLTLDTPGGEKINNANTVVSTTRYEAFIVVGDGADWWASKLTP
jgi:peroxiredoxin